MTEPTTVTAVTNPKPNTCVGVNCDCPTMWSMVQQDCYIRMGHIKGDMVYSPIKDYETRAKRIAGTYARFYLEEERGGDLAKKGRFYWMALACFASKTVACTLASWQVEYSAKAISTMKEGLGKGNFWLFCDIAGWHWYYTQFNEDFDLCLAKRDASTLTKAVQAQTKIMQWGATALPKINNLKVTSYIKDGFAKVKEFESAKKDKQRDIQIKHLLIIADHEQKMILQPLIYDDPGFAAGVQLQRAAKSKTNSVENAVPAWRLIRNIVQALTPGLELVFASACTTSNKHLKSVAPEETKLEQFKSRMDWITSAAEQFHGLMATDKDYMESQINEMAGWYDLADK